jgi:hypothetical protein
MFSKEKSERVLTLQEVGSLTRPESAAGIHDGDSPGPPQYDANYDADPFAVQCPPHTTEQRLVYRIDLHVIPWLCVMYLLAFLDR